MNRLIARFRPQEWHGDAAVEVEGAKDFDATKALLDLPLERIQKFRMNDYDSDELSEDLPERQEHDGPFEVDVDLDKWLEENGVPYREVMTESDRQRLRLQYLDADRLQQLYAKGYRYYLTPTDNSFEALGVKTLVEIGPVLRSYPDKIFYVFRLCQVGKEIQIPYQISN